MRSTVRVGATAGLLFPNVRLAPLWSHCTTVKCSSQGANKANVQQLVTSPGPPCSSSSTGFVRSCSRILTHCSMPPIGTQLASSMPVGDRIENCSALRPRRNETRASSLRYSGSSPIGCCGSLANWPSAVPPRELSKRPHASAERSNVPLLNHEGSVSLVPISGSKRHFYCCFLGRFDDDWVPGEYATIVFRSATQGTRRGTKRVVRA